jgi:apolipoprotein N-acyltransferase
MVRAVNSGVSALIDPNGRLQQKTYADDPYRNPRAEDGIVVSVPGMPGGHTVYVAVGNLFAYLCVAATLLLGLSALRDRPSRGSWDTAAPPAPPPDVPSVVP